MSSMGPPLWEGLLGPSHSGGKGLYSSGKGLLGPSHRGGNEDPLLGHRWPSSGYSIAKQWKGPSHRCGKGLSPVLYAVGRAQEALPTAVGTRILVVAAVSSRSHSIAHRSSTRWKPFPQQWLTGALRSGGPPRNEDPISGYAVCLRARARGRARV